MAQGTILNYIKSIKIDNLRDGLGNIIPASSQQSGDVAGEYMPFRVIEGASYAEGDINHNYLEAESSNNPLFDAPTQDPGVFTFSVADMESELLVKICGATYNSSTGEYTIPSNFPTRIGDVKITLKKDGSNLDTGYVKLTDCQIVAKQVGEDLKTNLWHAEIQCTCKGQKIIHM